WIMVLIEKIVELMSFARITIGQDAQAGKLAIALETFASHHQRAHDRFTHGWNLRQGTTEACRGNLQELRFLGFAAHGRNNSCPGEHRDVANKIPRPGHAEDLLLTIARFKNVELSAQDETERHVALTSFVDNLAPFDFAARA